MKLYWKDTEIGPGSLLRVVEHDYEVVNNFGKRAEVTWRITEIRTRGPGDDYYEPNTGKTFSLKKVMKNRRLHYKQQSGGLVQIPPCTNYLVIKEFHDGEPALWRCYNVDMLGLIRKVEVLE